MDLGVPVIKHFKVTYLERQLYFLHIKRKKPSKKDEFIKEMTETSKYFKKKCS